MKTALLLVDIQNDYFPGGKMELDGSLEASWKARDLLSYFRGQQRALVHIQHISTRAGATFFLPNTSGIDFHENVLPAPGETMFQKHFPNSFRDTPLLSHLHAAEVGRLLICGMMTHMCIDTTTRAAYDLGFECLLARDACATRSLTFQGQSVSAQSVHLAFLAALNGTFAKVCSVKEILAQLSAE